MLALMAQTGIKWQDVADEAQANFTSETIPTDQTGPKASPGGRKPKDSGTTKAKRR